MVVDVPGNRRALVINVMGRLFMDALDDPFRAVQAEVQKHRLGAGGTIQASVIDVHAEASSEKQAFGHSFDGLVSLVVGTHTHTPTADHQVLAGGTAYQTDAGFTGPHDSVIGSDPAAPIQRFLTERHDRYRVADGRAELNGVRLELEWNRAVKIERVRIVEGE